MRRGILINGALLVLVFALVPTVTFAQGEPIVSPPPITSKTETTVNLVAPQPDPKVTAQNATEGSQAIIMAVLVPPPIKWAQQALSIPDIWRTTPPDLTYNNSQVRQVADLIRDVALGLLAVMIFVLGLQKGLGQSDANGGRIILAAVLAIGSLAFWQFGIDLNNGINNAIAAPSLADLIKPSLTVPNVTDVGLITPDQIASAVLLVVYAIVGLIVMFSLFVRLVLIDVLIVVGPLCLLCFALDQTENIATGYLRVATGLLFSQIAYVIVFKLAGVFAGLGTGMVGVLLGLGVLLVMPRIPGMLMHIPNSGGSGRGRFMALMLLRRLVLRF